MKLTDEAMYYGLDFSAIYGSLDLCFTWKLDNDTF